MTVDAVADGAYATVLTPPSPATSGTSLVVETGEGTVFPTPPFDLTMWPPGVLPLTRGPNANAEIGRCTNVSTDTVTVTRNAYGYGAKAVAAGWQCGQVITKNLMDEIIAGVTGPTGPTGPAGPAQPYAGSVPSNLAWLAPVAWVYESAVGTIDAYTYANGSSGVGATVTQNTPGDGALSIDGGTPSLGDRVLFYDWNGGPTANGIYTVTALGDGSSVPWVLTRATDNDADATLLQYWAVGVVGTGVLYFTGSQAYVTEVDDTGIFSGGVGYGHVYLGLAAFGAGPVGYAAVGSQTGATPTGNRAIATAEDAIAPGNSSKATGRESVALGSGSIASGIYSQALTKASVAYGDGQTVDAAYEMDAQHSFVVGKVLTTDATPTPFNNIAGNACLLRMVDTFGEPDWSKTLHVKATVVARLYGMATSAVWFIDGALEGDDGSSYAWVGGAAPTAVPASYNDVATSTWGVALSLGTDPTSSAAAIIATATGADSTTIVWECTLEIDEVSG